MGKCLKMAEMANFLKPYNTFLAIWQKVILVVTFELLNQQTRLNHHFVAKIDLSFYVTFMKIF